MREEDETIAKAIVILEQRLRREGTLMRDPNTVRRWLQLRLADKQIEIFGMVLLDTQHRLIAWCDVAHGTIDAAPAYPREVVRQVLEHNAAAVVFAYNYPSGHNEPSTADRTLTQSLQTALQLIDVRVLGHFVVGSAYLPVSFAERGWLSVGAMASYTDLYEDQNHIIDSLTYHYPRQFRQVGALWWPKGWNTLVETCCRLVEAVGADLTWSLMDDHDGRLRMRRRATQIRMSLETAKGEPASIFIRGRHHRHRSASRTTSFWASNAKA